MKTIETTCNTTVIKYDNYQEFLDINKEVNRYGLACLTFNNMCISARSYIYPETKIVREGRGTYIYDLVVFSDSSYVSCHHKKLMVYWTESGGYYAKTRFGRAWLNSFFGIPRDGEYERILTGEEVIKTNKLQN